MGSGEAGEPLIVTVDNQVSKHEPELAIRCRAASPGFTRSYDEQDQFI
jgi:hypothetical protein